jgi:hypothetical protein
LKCNSAILELFNVVGPIGKLILSSLKAIVAFKFKISNAAKIKDKNIRSGLTHIFFMAAITNPHLKGKTSSTAYP